MSDVIPMPNALPAEPSDLAERRRALDPGRSFLVQAPAGSGKTYLLTQRFLRLLGEAEKPEEIVAITFTKAAAAEMLGRVLGELEKAERAGAGDSDPLCMASLAWRALERSRVLGWRLLALPGQLRVTTIDAFCRGIALQCPLSWGGLTELGGRLESVEKPEELYREAARRTLGLIAIQGHPVRRAVEELLRLRDNNWADVEALLVKMLKERNRWFQEFVFLQSEATEEDWAELRARLERPFRREVERKLAGLGQMLEGLEGCREYALTLAREACATPGRNSPMGLAERAEFPAVSSEFEELSAEELEDALAACGDLARFLQTKDKTWRKRLDATLGYPAGKEGKAGKERFAEFVTELDAEPGLEAALGAFQEAMPVRYTEAEWELIRHSFAVMREAWGQLQRVFAEAGSVDFTEVARIALQALGPVDGYPSEFALRYADGIRHLLVDEFQDTSRNQHLLLARLVGAWPEREGRSVFCVGDPMQSIYGFRDAEVELFERLKTHGLEAGEAFRLEFVRLTANFRTVPGLVGNLNERFERIFAEDDGSGVRFARAEAARTDGAGGKAELHVAFSAKEDAAGAALEQLGEVVELIRGRLEAAREVGADSKAGRFRVAVLGRTKKVLMPVAEALREAGIGFRTVDLVPLKERAEVLDALALVRALLNPVDRTAWLGVLRAPWCGLTLEELYWVTSADEAEVIAAPLPGLLGERLERLRTEGRLSGRGYEAAARVGAVMRAAAAGRSEASTEALGTWVERVWKALGGGETVNREQRENLGLLWRSLDRLAEGEVDLLGRGLEVALEGLFAQPDPEVSAEFGVQLMTIHKSKGLEFEVVIVPGLEGVSRNSDPALLSWLERGLADDGEELTEFLIGPIQTKGGEAGAAKKWVDGVRKAREKAEMRRLLYVAATRAREELHLFARMEAKKDGLGTAAGLLGTAWPAVEEEVQGRFAEWQAGLVEVAAGAEILTMPRQIAGKPTVVRRLPEGFVGPGLAARSAGDAGVVEVREDPLYARTEGGVVSRLEGIAIHALMEELSRLRKGLAMAEALGELRGTVPGVVAMVRGKGLAADEARRLVEEAFGVVERVAVDAEGDWVLAPHDRAQTEVGWTGLVRAEDGRERLANLRPDRVFFAAGPGESAKCWWILDYKTSFAGGLDMTQEEQRRAFVVKHRAQHEGQLRAYAQVLRSLVGPEATAVRAGIYYPRLRLLDCWEA